jgi:hypothetical protein
MQQSSMRSDEARGGYEGKRKQERKRKWTDKSGATGSAALNGSEKQQLGPRFKEVDRVPPELEAGVWTFVKKSQEYDVKEVMLSLLDGIEYPAVVIMDVDEYSGATFYTAEAPDIKDLCATRPSVRAVSGMNRFSS